MRVVTWTSPTDGVIARIEIPSGTKRGAVEFLPTVFHGTDEAALIEKAEAFYFSELERIQKQQEGGAARAAKIKAQHEARKAGKLDKTEPAPEEIEEPI